MKRAVLSLSGGLDSTCLLLYLLSEGYTVSAYSFFYGQKHSTELKGALKNVRFLRNMGFLLTHHVIDLNDCFSESNSSLRNPGISVPKGHYADENMKSTVVENRNVIFSAIIYGKALAWSNRENAPVDIFLGTHAGDHTVYPDTTVESRKACEHAFKVSNWGGDRVNYKAPFESMHKGEVLSCGLSAMHKMNFSTRTVKKIMKNTHTCYNPNEKGEACGVCGSCNERLEAWNYVGLADPIKYQSYGSIS